MGGFRIGFVSSYDEKTGMASVHYPDRCAETTAMMPILSPFGLLQKLKKGDAVAVVHLSNDSTAGIILGEYSAADGVPSAHIEVENGLLTFKDTSGSISLAEILAIKRAHESEG